MRRAIITLSLVLAVTAVVYLVTVDETGALPGSQTTTIYFSDAAMTNDVGIKTVYCNGSWHLEGSTGPYRLVWVGPSCFEWNESICYVCYNDNGRYSCPLNEAPFKYYPECP